MAASTTVDGAASGVAASLERARRWEPRIDAWACLDDAPPPAACTGGALAGVAFAVKDVIDVAGLPTRYGSAVFAAAAPAPRDAAVVAALRAAGAVPIGKTRSTEFAFVDPTGTRNPYDSGRTPGGSSSGSGAVVGAGIVPFALGTQTAGSLVRPAAYCGAFAYKPGLGVLPVDGVAPLSRSFDAVGVIAASAGWLARVFAVLQAAFAIPAAAPAGGRPLRIAHLRVAGQAPEPAMAAAADAAAAAFRAAGHAVADVPAPVPFDRLVADHRTVMLAEMARDLPGIVGRGRDRLGPRLSAGLAEGERLPAGGVDAAAAAIAGARHAFWPALAGHDLVLALAVPGAAPAGLATTGDQSYLTPWTTLGGPLVGLPAGCDGDGLPLGLLLAAAPGCDAFLVAAATDLAGLLPPTPRPA